MGRAEAPAPEQARGRQRRAWRKELATLRKIRFLLAICPGAGPLVREQWFIEAHHHIRGT